MADENGGLIGTILYDAYGSVLSNTIPVTLDPMLVGQGIGIGAWVGITAGLGGPVTFVVVTASGVAVFVAWEGLIKPGVSWVFPKVGLRDPYQEYRNLKPLGGGH